MGLSAEAFRAVSHFNIKPEPHINTSQTIGEVSKHQNPVKTSELHYAAISTTLMR